MSKCVLGNFSFASSHEPVLIQYNSTLSKMVDLQPKEFGLYFFCPKNLQRLFDYVLVILSKTRCVLIKYKNVTFTFENNSEDLSESLCTLKWLLTGKGQGEGVKKYLNKRHF